MLRSTTIRRLFGRIPGGLRSRRLLLLGLGAAALSGTASGDVPSDDGVPAGAVAFFNVSGGCPPGWLASDEATGRLVVAVTSGVEVGTAIGTPLANQEDRMHQHTYAGSIDLPYKSISGADGTSGDGAQAGMYPVAGSTSMAPTGLPFIQLLACERQ